MQDTYVQVRVFDKFVRNDENVYESANKKFDVGTKKFNKNTNSNEYTVHVPADWRQQSGQLAAMDELEENGIVCAFKQGDLACVYMTKWTQKTDNPTFTMSVALRKRFAREMLNFWLENTFLPKLTLTKGK